VKLAAAQRYLLRLSGSAWQPVVDASTPQLQAALTADIAALFFTTADYVTITNVTVGSLVVDFSVAPAVDGTQLRESAFLALGSAPSTAWLAETLPLYPASASRDEVAVTSARYADPNQTPPAMLSQCGAQCGGYIAAGGVVLFVVVVFLFWAWRRKAKADDAAERKRLDDIIAAAEPTDPAPAAAAAAAAGAAAVTATSAWSPEQQQQQQWAADEQQQHQVQQEQQQHEHAPAPVVLASAGVFAVPV
jgi:hypothetical protein